MEQADYLDRREKYVEYLMMKVQMSDWHGVSDAANDLRELDAEWRGENNAKGEKT